MSVVEAPIETKTFSRAAIVAEQGRRKNNKTRRRNGQPSVKAKSYVLPALSKGDIASLLAGETVQVSFASGRRLLVSVS